MGADPSWISKKAQPGLVPTGMKKPRPIRGRDRAGQHLGKSGDLPLDNGEVSGWFLSPVAQGAAGRRRLNSRQMSASEIAAAEKPELTREFDLASLRLFPIQLFDFNIPSVTSG